MAVRPLKFLLILASLVALIIWCSFQVPTSWKWCDFDGFLNDPKVHESYRAALTRFSQQNDIQLDNDSTGAICAGEYKVYKTLGYHTPLTISKYNIQYEWRLAAVYSFDSDTVDLHFLTSSGIQIYDESTKTSDVINYINSLATIIAKFESYSYVNEFAKQFRNYDIIGTIYEDSLWIEPARWNQNINAQIWFDIPKRSIDSYTIPNRVVLDKLSEIEKVHRIVNEELLAGDLSNCAISTEMTSEANTSIYFLSDESIRAYVDLTCTGVEEDTTLHIVLHPDGSYTSEIK